MLWRRSVLPCRVMGETDKHFKRCIGLHFIEIVRLLLAQLNTSIFTMCSKLRELVIWGLPGAPFPWAPSQTCGAEELGWEIQQPFHIGFQVSMHVSTKKSFHSSIYGDGQELLGDILDQPSLLEWMSELLPLRGHRKTTRVRKEEMDGWMVTILRDWPPSLPYALWTLGGAVGTQFSFLWKTGMIHIWKQLQQNRTESNHVKLYIKSRG